jgi:hypothetical protein
MPARRRTAPAGQGVLGADALDTQNFSSSKRAAAVLKHAILGGYIVRFASKTGSASRGNRVVIVDGYAGAGRYDTGEPGSPALIAAAARLRRRDRLAGARAGPPIDQSTTTPIATHSYGSAFDGSMQVRVTAADGGVANASAFVHVGTALPRLPAPAAPTNLTLQEVAAVGDTSTVRLSWSPSDSLAAEWAITLNGVPVGLTAAATTSVEITDVNRLADVSLGVAGVTSNDVVGDEGKVVLPKRSGPPAPPQFPALDVVPGSAENPINLAQRWSRAGCPVVVLDG